MKLLRTFFWKRLDSMGSECTSLWQLGQGWKLQGVVLAAPAGIPTHVVYSVRCNSDWESQEVSLRVLQGTGQRKLHLLGQEGRWKIDEKEIVELQGCSDVDLEFTPATNFLPIRRLNLAPGQSAEIRVAWIRFPSCGTQSVMQRYSCLSNTRYRYECGSFSAEITVGPHGFPVHYPKFWELVGEISDSDCTVT